MSNELLPGTIIYDHYKINECISTADFSNIYIAEDLNENNKKVIIKELLYKAIATNDRVKALGKFQEEIDMYKKLDHPNMAKIIECFSSESAVYTENKQFIVMEYIEGKTIRKIKDEKKEDLLPDDAGKWFIQIIEAIKYLSEQNPPSVFYYFTPDHVMITEEGNVKLINFGLGRFFRTGPFKSNQYMGIAGYAAPEQYGIKPVDNRADIFGAGALIYYMLTQDDPEKHALNFSPVRTMNTLVSMQFARFISKCVQMKPEDRCENINEVIEKLSSMAFTDTQISPDRIKKKEESKTKKSQPKQVVGKELEGWHEALWWNITTHPVLGNRGFQAGLMVILLIIIYMAWVKRDILVPSLSIKNKPPSLYYSLEERNNLDVIDLNTSKVSSNEIGQQIISLVYSDKLTSFYGITSDNNLIEINPGSNEITKKMASGIEPSSIKLSSDRQIAYITNKGSSNINIIDLTTFKNVVSPVLVGSGPSCSAMSSDGTMIYILNSQQDTISFFNTKNNNITDSVKIESEGKDITLNFNNTKLYITYPNSDNIIIMDVNNKQITNKISVETGLVGLATNHMADEMYVIANKTKDLQLLNINGVIKYKIPLDFIPIGIVCPTSGKKLFITGRSLSGYVIAEFDTLNKKITVLSQVERNPLFILPVYIWE
jgi:serine/threonine protein kinase